MKKSENILMSIDDAHVIVHSTTGRMAVWKRGSSPTAPFVFANEKTAQHFHEVTLGGDRKWKPQRAINVMDILNGFVYIRREDGTDVFLSPRRQHDPSLN